MSDNIENIIFKSGVDYLVQQLKSANVNLMPFEKTIEKAKEVENDRIAECIFVALKHAYKTMKK